MFLIKIPPCCFSETRYDKMIFSLSLASKRGVISTRDDVVAGTVIAITNSGKHLRRHGIIHRPVCYQQGLPVVNDLRPQNTRHYSTMPVAPSKPETIALCSRCSRHPVPGNLRLPVQSTARTLTSGDKAIAHHRHCLGNILDFDSWRGRVAASATMQLQVPCERETHVAENTPWLHRRN